LRGHAWPFRKAFRGKTRGGHAMPDRKCGGAAMFGPDILDFFRRKLKIAFFALMIYAALC
jgi:hypothetical protein